MRNWVETCLSRQLRHKRLVCTYHLHLTTRNQQSYQRLQLQSVRPNLRLLFLPTRSLTLARPSRLNKGPSPTLLPETVVWLFLWLASLRSRHNPRDLPPLLNNNLASNLSRHPRNHNRHLSRHKARLKLPLLPSRLPWPSLAVQHKTNLLHSQVTKMAWTI